ncbi:flavocytochrome c, partial [Escherichia coli]
YITTNQEGSTGDGITMIEKLGGQTVDMDKIQIHPTVQQDEGILIGEVVRGEGAILVNQEGKRFVNEMDTRDKVSAAI